MTVTVAANAITMCRDDRPAVAEAGRLLAAEMRLPRKVLVTDLDGTLWEGVAAERTLVPKLDREARVADVRRLGGLLAIATWNQSQDVTESFVGRVFDRDFVRAAALAGGPVLDLGDFAAIEAGYDPKPAMLRRIAEKLGLSLDSFVYMDDDPMQRAHVAQELPGVIVLTPDDDPRPYFEPVTLTDEDRRRATMYQEERKREAAQRAESDPRAFLRSLGLKVRIEMCRPEQRARVAQLLERTTQFNLTGSRGLDVDAVRVASATDRFGDCGLVAAALVTEHLQVREIENLVMSCRVLGRGIETALLRSVAERYGLPLTAIFVPTARNAPAADFLAHHGFACRYGFWRLEDLRRIPPCDHLDVEDLP